MKKTLIFLIIVMAIIIVGFAVIILTIDMDKNNNDLVTVEKIIEKLPKEISIGDRVVLVDTNSVSFSEREEFGSLNEAVPLYIQGENPLDFVERYLKRDSSLEHILDSPINMFNYSVSFYPMEENNGLSVFVNVMNFPDDSIGGEESRFDFVLDNGEWKLKWSGSRVFCRRMNNEYWAPWGELCP